MADPTSPVYIFGVSKVMLSIEELLVLFSAHNEAKLPLKNFPIGFVSML